MRTSFARIHVGQKFLLENVAAAFSKGVARGSITKIYGLIISWGSSRMICCDWNHVWRAWASAGCVTATKARKIYLHCLLSTQMIGSDTLPRHKQWRNALGFCVLSDREGGECLPHCTSRCTSAQTKSAQKIHLQRRTKAAREQSSSSFISILT